MMYMLLCQHGDRDEPCIAIVNCVVAYRYCVVAYRYRKKHARVLQSKKFNDNLMSDVLHINNDMSATA